MANVTEMPPPETPETVDTEPKTESTSTPTTPEPAKKHKPGPGRGKKKDDADKPARTAEFFAQVAAIPAEEWGQRAYMYVYIDEPVLQANTWGKYTYAKKLSKPIFDLEPVKDWYGSCKGWLSLNFRKSTKQSGDQMATHEFEIFDIHCAPKIPRKSWANDQRNLKWEAILPPEKPEQSSQGAGPLLDGIKVYKEIVADVKDEMQSQAPPPSDQTRATLETMKLARELFAPAADPNAPKPADPLATAVSLAQTLLTLRTDNPMVEMLRDELREARAELRKARETAPAASQPKGLLEQLTELATVAEKFEPLRKLLGGGGSEPVVRTGRTNGLDILRDIAPQFLQSPIAQGLGILLTNLATRTATATPTAPQVITNPPANGQAPPQETEMEKIMRIARNISDPLVIEFFEPWAESGGKAEGNSGRAFAERVYDMWPSDFEYLKSKGGEAIITMYLQNPTGAARLKPKEQQFRQFITEFCAFDPNGEDGAPQQQPMPSTVRDLENEENTES